MKKGSHHSEEARCKISEAHKGKTLSEDHRCAISEALREKPRSEETRCAISAALKGKSLSEETHRAISETLKGRPGKPCSEETRSAISEALRGKPLSEDHRRALRGKKRSEETRRRISETQKKSERVHAARARCFRHKASFPERLVAARLENAGVNFKWQAYLPGLQHPYDFLLPEKRVVIEEDGCRFHDCKKPGCKYRGNPSSRAGSRDSEVTLHAIKQGYRVIHLWEHDVLAPRRPVFAADYVGVVAVTFCRWKEFDRDLQLAKKYFY